MDDIVHNEPNNASSKVAPVMDAVVPKRNDLDSSRSHPHQGPATPTTAPSVPPKAFLNTQVPHAKGNAGAIVGTVIIVVALAMLATYAYIKTV